MANPEHVEIVKQGREAIDAWVKTSHGPGMDLEGVDLTKVVLTGADLGGANLRRADLRGAELGFSNLSAADLSGADIRKAQLIGADLRLADLREVDLRWADLRVSNLNNASLRAANLENAWLGKTILADLDLSEVKGLELVSHDGPSTIGVDTLYRSHGKIPEVFLRGCGVPDDFITFIPSLTGAMEPIQFQSCFISYSSKDDEFARRLYGRMRDEKLRVWFAPEDMHGGKKSIEQIDRAIQVNDRLLLVLSKHSMNSEWVRREIKRARAAERIEKRTKLFPIALAPFTMIKKWRCDDADTGEDLAEKIREYHIPDFSNWKDHDAFESAFTDLLRDLRAQA